MAGAAVRQIIPVHGGDYHMFQPQSGHGLGQMFRLGRIDRVGPAAGDIAEGAGSGADLSQDHEGGGAVLPAVADIGAGGLLADSVQLQFAHGAADGGGFRRQRCAHLQPFGLARHRQSLPAHLLRFGLTAHAAMITERAGGCTPSPVTIHPCVGGGFLAVLRIEFGPRPDHGCMRKKTMGAMMAFNRVITENKPRAWSCK